MIIWAWGALEADFQRFYNMDLNYIHRNNLITWRKFLILIKGLPDNSAYYYWYKNKDNRNFVELSENSDIDIYDSIGKC